MKKIVLFAAAAWLVAACSPKEISVTPSAPKARVFNATMEATRSFLDGNNVCWEADWDEICVFDKTTENLRYYYTGEDGATQGSFSPVSDPSGDGSSLNYVYASYPYDSLNEASEGSLLVWFSPRQDYLPDSFGACPMVAVSEDENLQFKNLCGFLCIPLYGDLSESISEVDVFGNNGEILSGDLLVSVEPGGEPTVELGTTSYANKYTFVSPSEPVQIGSSKSTATNFWICLPPMTFESGISVVVYGSKGSTFSFVSNNPLTIKRSVCTKAAAVEVEFPEIEEDPVTKAYIEENLAGTYIFNITAGYDGAVYNNVVNISYNVTASGNVHMEGEFIDIDLNVEAKFDPETGILSIPGFSVAGSIYGYYPAYLAWVADGYIQDYPIEFSLDAPHSLSFVEVVGGTVYILYYDEGWNGWDSCSPFNSVTYQGPLSAPKPKAKVQKLSSGDAKEFVIDRAPKAKATAPVVFRKTVR